MVAAGVGCAGARRRRAWRESGNQSCLWHGGPIACNGAISAQKCAGLAPVFGLSQLGTAVRLVAARTGECRSLLGSGQSKGARRRPPLKVEVLLRGWITWVGSVQVGLCLFGGGGWGCRNTGCVVGLGAERLRRQDLQGGTAVAVRAVSRRDPLCVMRAGGRCGCSDRFMNLLVHSSHVLSPIAILARPLLVCHPQPHQDLQVRRPVFRGGG